MTSPGQPGTSVTDTIVPTDSAGHDIPGLVPVAFAPDGWIYQPGATYPNGAPWGLNQCNDFGLVAGVAKAAHGGTIFVDTSLSSTLPAGTFDFGAGVTLASRTGADELDADDGATFTSAPLEIDRLSLTTTSDTTSLITLPANAILRLSGAYLLGNGARPVIDYNAGASIVASAETFLDVGSVFIPAGGLATMTLSQGSAFGTGAFVFEDGTSSLQIQIADGETIAALLAAAPDIGALQNTSVTNISGITSFVYNGSLSLLLAASTSPDQAGAWSVGFTAGAPPLVSADLGAFSGAQGMLYGVEGRQVVQQGDGVAIRPPSLLTLQDLDVQGNAADVSLFTTTTRIEIRDSVLSVADTKKPLIDNSGTVALYNSTLSLPGEGAGTVVTGGELELWDGAAVDSGAFAGGGAIHVRGTGVRVATSYGDAIQLYPGVPFAAQGSPVDAAVTATGGGCVYVDTDTGIEWTSWPLTGGGFGWRQVNAAVFAYTNAAVFDVVSDGGFQGPWTITFSAAIGFADLVSADLSIPAEWEGTWKGFGGSRTAIAGPAGVSITPPQSFVVQDLDVAATATDVALFVASDADQSVRLVDSSFAPEEGSGALPVWLVSAGTTTLSLLRSALRADGTTPSVAVADGAVLQIPVWEGGVVEAHAVDTSSGTTQLHARAAGAAIDISYGAAIFLYPGVPFAAAGTPDATAVSPTGAGCMYVDKTTGIVWTFDGAEWGHP